MTTYRTAIHGTLQDKEYLEARLARFYEDFEVTLAPIPQPKMGLLQGIFNLFLV